MDKIFKAFAEESRLRILNLLNHQKELCVCDIIAVLKMGQSKASRHLSYLKRSGLVRDRKQGLWSFYSLAEPRGKFHKQILNCLGNCFDEVRVLKKDLEGLREYRKNGCCK